jgi:hypothetical protein
MTGRLLHWLLRGLGIAWALPNSLLGFAIGLATLATGGGVRRVGRAIEFHGGLAAWLLQRAAPLEGGAMAITLGHVILGRTAAALDISREHEWVHVGQYERWGPFFIPAYLLASLALWLAGRDPYRENPFERAAYRRDSPAE